MRNFVKKLFILTLVGALVLNLSVPAFYIDSVRFGIKSYAAESGKVNTDRLNVRSGPGTDYSVVAVLSANTDVTINSETRGSDGYIWYAVSWSGGSGYARNDYIQKATVYSVSDSDFEAYLTAQGFPESYKNDLRGLHEQHPNWVFKAQHTGLDWNDVLAAENKIGKSLIASSSISSWKSLAAGAFDWANNYWPGFDGASWVQASEDLVAHYLDPRNFLTDPYIFQFELQTYDPSLQTREGLEALVSGTFLAGDAIVPVEGSVIEGGTIIPGSSLNSDSGSSPSSSGTTVITSGPGSSSFSSGVIISPGVTLTSQAAPGRVLNKLFGTVTAYAGYWQLSSSVWYYYDDNGSVLKDGWYWLDGNNDGTAECYYFYSDGSMAASTVTPDNYAVDSEGRWTVDGVIQTKPASEAYSTGSSSSAGQLKKVPYTDIIMYAAQASGVSPYVIASTIIQEQGSGTSDLISGTNSTYPGYYNFFNTNAYEHDGMSAVVSGLKYACEKGWDTIEKSIIGGAENYGTNYVNKGQDTFYLKKFNVQGDNLYNHQYMTHVLAAASEGAKVSAAYSDSFKNNSITFKIPVYNNMPDTPVSLPSGDGNPNNKLSSLGVDGFTITPTFDMDTYEYSLIVDGSVSSVNINAVKIDSNASVSGAGTVYPGVGSNRYTVTVTAENGDVRYYYINITRREDISVPQGVVISDNSTSSDSASYGPGGASVSTGGSGGITSSESSGTVTIGASP